MLRKSLFVCIVSLLFASVASAQIVANTATVLPEKTYSVTAGVTIVPVSPVNLGYFGMVGMGLGKDIDLGLKWIYQDYIGLDAELGILKDKEVINLSGSLGAHYSWGSSVFGLNATLLLSKYFKPLEPYFALDYQLNFGSSLSSGLNAVIGVDIKLVKPVTLVLEADLPLLNLGQTGWKPYFLAGVCLYLGDNPPF